MSDGHNPNSHGLQQGGDNAINNTTGAEGGDNVFVLLLNQLLQQQQQQQNLQQQQQYTNALQQQGPGNQQMSAAANFARQLLSGQANTDLQNPLLALGNNMLGNQHNEAVAPRGILGQANGMGNASTLGESTQQQQQQQQQLPQQPQLPNPQNSQPFVVPDNNRNIDEDEEMKVQLEKAKELLASTTARPSGAAVSSTPQDRRDNSIGGDMVQQVGNTSSTVVPCRARGMPMDHNFKTAYFVIPEDIKHGAQLVCSYPACRNGGVKFRYCDVCKIPVAKRNFRNRHNHDDHRRGSAPPAPAATPGVGETEEGGHSFDIPQHHVPPPVKHPLEGRQPLSKEGDGEISKKYAPDTASGGDKNEEQVATHIKEEGQHEQQKEHAASPSGSGPLSSSETGGGKATLAQGSTSKSFESPADSLRSSAVGTEINKARTSIDAGMHPNNTNMTRKRDSPDGHITPGDASSSKRPRTQGTEAEGKAIESDDDGLNPERKAKWISLLMRRPFSDDGDAMSAWMMEVLAVSDPKKDFGVRAVGGAGSRTRHHPDHTGTDDEGDSGDTSSQTPTNGALGQADELVSEDMLSSGSMSSSDMSVGSHSDVRNSSGEGTKSSPSSQPSSPPSGTPPACSAPTDHASPSTNNMGESNGDSKATQEESWPEMPPHATM